MRGVFDDEDEFRPVERRRDTHRRDTELTLGPAMLLLLFFGLALLCGLCFSLGYTMGSRGSQASPLAAQQSGLPASSQTGDAQPKPPAAQQGGAPPQQSAVNGQPASAISGASPAAASQNPGSSSAAGASFAQPVVKPALPAEPTAPAPASGQPAPTLAAAPEQPLMVQIAAVSQQEDADVLVAALRRHGYAVTVRRDPADDLFHVRIGSFRSRGEANAMRRKLLNDGYNAIVQP
jgi:cell division septation protein DedD